MILQINGLRLYECSRRKIKDKKLKRNENNKMNDWPTSRVIGIMWHIEIEFSGSHSND